ncbi:hypothetical protein ACOSQ3_032510 [Xanthoceras sorbifolium]
MCRGLERLVKVVPLISYVPHPLENILEVTTKDISEEQTPFAAGIDKEESDEEKLVRSTARKDKDHSSKELEVVLDSGSAMGTNLPIPTTEVAGSSRVNDVSLLPSLFVEEVLGKVLKGEICSAYQDNTDGFLGNIVER